MNIKVMAFLTKSSNLGFVFACALIGGAGWGAKIGVEQMGSIYDEFSESFNHPSPVFVQIQHRTSKSAVAQPPTHSATLALPTNPVAFPLP